MTNNVGDLHARRQQQQRLQLGKSKLVSFCLLKTFIVHTHIAPEKHETWNMKDKTIIKRIRYEIATEQSEYNADSQLKWNGFFLGQNSLLFDLDL